VRGTKICVRSVSLQGHRTFPTFCGTNNWKYRKSSFGTKFSKSYYDNV